MNDSALHRPGLRTLFEDLVFPVGLRGRRGGFRRTFLTSIRAEENPAEVARQVDVRWKETQGDEADNELCREYRQQNGRYQRVTSYSNAVHKEGSQYERDNSDDSKVPLTDKNAVAACWTWERQVEIRAAP